MCVAGILVHWISCRAPAAVATIDRLLSIPMSTCQHLKSRQSPPRSGLLAGAELLTANVSSFSFMVLVTDGENNGFGDPVETAEGIRADNTTTIFAVGVGV